MDLLVQELTEITASVSDGKKVEVLGYVAKCLEPNTPTYEVSPLSLENAFVLYRSVPEEHRQRFEEIIDEVGKRMHERGYREDYHTWQEHTLMGSTVWIEYGKEPHKPIGVIKGDLSVAEAQKARELARRQSAFGRYFGLDDMVSISLEPLDETGNTVRDPRVLDDGLNPVATNYSADFPARRE